MVLSNIVSETEVSRSPETRPVKGLPSLYSPPKIRSLEYSQSVPVGFAPSSVEGGDPHVPEAWSWCTQRDLSLTHNHRARDDRATVIQGRQSASRGGSPSPLLLTCPPGGKMIGVTLSQLSYLIWLWEGRPLSLLSQKYQTAPLHNLGGKKTHFVGILPSLLVSSTCCDTYT